MAKKPDSFYFDNYVACADLAVQAAELLIKIFENFDSAKIHDMLDKMHAIEHAADKKHHELEDALLTAFITPLEREDLDLMSCSLDTVLDRIEGVVQRVYFTNIQSIHPDAIVTHGLPDEAFLRGAGEGGVVPMTKSEVRAVALSKLRLTERAVCYDIGAGTGSVAIEMALQAKHGHVYAVERRDDAVELLKKNQAAFHVENLTVVSGTAPEACRDLPAPTHVFIGGSAGNLRDILSMLLAKNPHVRIVATAVSLESIAELTACMKDFAFTEAEAVSVQIARGKKTGSYHLMAGQNPVYVFTMQSEEKL